MDVWGVGTSGGSQGYLMGNLLGNLLGSLKDVFRNLRDLSGMLERKDKCVLTTFFTFQIQNFSGGSE